MPRIGNMRARRRLIRSARSMSVGVVIFSPLSNLQVIRVTRELHGFKPRNERKIGSARLLRFAGESRSVRCPPMHGDLDRPYQGAFLGRTHHFALRAYFEDTDVSGVVYHANNLKYMERARSDML